MIVIDFIMTNYIWFLVAIIVILLAVIGSYAEKTNFGLGTKIEDDDKKDLNLEEIANKKLGDFVAVPNQEKNNNQKPVQLNTNVNVSNNEVPVNNVQNVNTISSETVTNNVGNFETNNIAYNTSLETNPNVNVVQVQLQPNEQSNNLLTSSNEVNNNLDVESNEIVKPKKEISKQIDLILPKKDVVDESLLDDIDSLSFDDFNFDSSLFKNDDILNTKVKTDDLKLPEIKSLKEDTDIWKF